MDIKTFLQKIKLESIAINQIEQFHSRNCTRYDDCNSSAMVKLWGGSGEYRHLPPLNWTHQRVVKHA